MNFFYINIFPNNCNYSLKQHCIKSVRIRCYSGLYFPAFGLNTERYFVSLRPNLNLVFNLIPLELQPLKIEFEEGLINFKILFLKAIPFNNN